MLANQAIVRFLEERGVRRLLHLPGVHTLPLNSALENSKIEVLMGRHEANVAFMADGFARATGKAGVVLVTPGPGLGNVVTPCMEAHGSDVPLVFIVIEADRRRADKGVLHGMKAPEALLSGIAKAIFVVSEAKNLIGELEAAFRAASSARKGPAAVFIPYPFLDKDVPFDAGAPGLHAEKTAAFDPGPIERLLKGSERPVIVGGGGLMEEGAGAPLDVLCSESSIPFLTSTRGKGALPEDREYAFGSVRGRGVAGRILNSADLVIAIGTRLREVDTKRSGVKLPRLVHIDVDDRWIGQNYRPEAAAITGDLKTAAESLRAIMKGRRSSWDIPRLAAARAKEEAVLEKESEGFRIVGRLRRDIPPETLTVWDLTLIYYWAELHFPVYRPRTFLSPTGISPIFYAFPAAAGARLGRPDAPCLCVTGDGSFTALAGELATLRAYGIPLVILVYNNGALGLLEGYMRRRYGMEHTMALTNPDLVRLAGSFGIKAKAAANPDELTAIFRRHVTWDEPFLIDFRYPPVAPPWE
jgi:acetolactate synthase-1/2/3 large subunit